MNARRILSAIHLSPKLLPALLLIGMECVSFAALKTWVGTGATGNWSTPANWAPAGAPANGDDLSFPAGAAQLINTNNLNRSFNSITFSGVVGGYILRGNGITLSAGITAANTAGANFIQLAITNGANQTVSATTGGTLNIDGPVALNGFTLTVNNSFSVSIGGEISGAGNLTKNGTGTLLLDGSVNNTYTGVTTVNNGTLNLNDSASANEMIPGNVVVNSAGTLLLSEGNQIADTATITISGSGLFHLNNFNEAIGNLLLTGGSVTTGLGTLTNGNITTFPAATAASISGNLHLGNATRTFDVGQGAASPDLSISATIAGGSTGSFPFVNYAGITKTGNGTLDLSAANTYFGHTTVNDGLLRVMDDNALGATFALFGSSGTTVNSGGQLTLVSADVGLEALIVNTPFVAMSASGSSSWSGVVTLNTNTTVTTGGTLAFSNSIVGAGGITFGGSSLSAIYRIAGTNENTYTGTTFHEAGTLQLAKEVLNGAIPGNLVIGDGVGTDGVVMLEINQIANTSTVTVNSNAFWNMGGFNDSVTNVVLTAGTITNGTLTLSGQSVTVHPSAVSSLIDATVRLFASSITFNVANGSVFSDLIVSGTITDNALVKTGGGTMTVSGSNTYSGQTTVNDGMLRVETDLGLGSSAAGTVVNSGATLRFTSPVATITEPLTLAGAGSAGSEGALELFGDGTIATNIALTAAATVDVESGLWEVIGVISGTGPLIKVGSGELRLSGSSANTFLGGAEVDGGILSLNKSSGIAVSRPVIIGDGASIGPEDVLSIMQHNQIPDTGNVIINGTGLFSMPSHNDTIGALSGSGRIDVGTTGDLTFGDFQDTVFSGSISGVTGQLTKQGSGTTTFTGNSSFGSVLGGSSLVLQGTLIINGIITNAPWAVTSTGNLGGVGTIGDLLVVGDLRPGTSPGIITVSNIAFAPAGNFFVELTGPTAGTHYDQTSVRGTVELGGATLHVNPAFSVPVQSGNQFRIINNDGADAVVGTFSGLPDDTTFALGGYQFTIDYDGGSSGNDVVLTLNSVPAASGAVAVSAGDGDHLIGPNECNSLHLVISNSTGVAITGIQATLASATEFLGISQPYSPYPNVPVGKNRTNNITFQISTLSNFVCGTKIDLDLIVKTDSHGTFVVPFELSSGAPALVPDRYDVSVVTNIPNIGTIESTNVVAGFSGPLSKVAVSLWLTHPITADLSVSLISPGGTVVDLSSGNGGGADFGSACAPDNVRTTFDDAAATSITAGASPFTGAFRPEGSLASISSGSGDGEWRLRITDSVGGSLGALRCWSLFLYGTACSPGSGNCDFCTAQITGSIDGSDLQLTNRLFRDGFPVNCGEVQAFPGYFGTGLFYYDSYVFTNTSPNEACVTVQVDADCSVHSQIYLHEFNPNDLAANYVGDSGSSANSGIPTVFSAPIPAGARFVVVLNATTNGSSCGNYMMRIGGLPCPAPDLAIHATGTNQVRVHWPTWAADYRLENNLDLTTTNWISVTNEPIVGGNRLNVTNSSVTPTNRFYRLTKP